MSSAPPPPFASGTPAPPPWQPPAAVPGKGRRSRLLVVIGALVAVVAVAAGALLVLGGGDDDGPPLDAEQALEGMERLIRDEGDEDDESDDAFALFDDCPLGVADELGETVEDAIEVDLELESEGSSFGSIDGSDVFIGCIVGAVGAELTIAVFADPRGRKFRDLRSENDGDVTRGPQSDHRGGTIDSFCAEPEDGELTSCHAGWSGDDILVYVDIAAEDVEVDHAITGLQALLDPVIEALVDEA